VPGANEVRLSGQLVERDVLRHTPAGLPAVGFRIRHASQQTEAERPRSVECEIQAVALGRPAHLVAAASLGSEIALTGFLAQKSLRNKTPVLHVTNIEFLEGNQHGIQTEVEDRSQA
jgi:primosomal replication protein N